MSALDLSRWQLEHPLVLWALALLPLLWLMRERSPAGLRPWRSFGAMVLRGMALMALILALAGPFEEITAPDRSIVVVVDASASLDPARAADLIQLLVEIAAETGRTLVASLHATEFVRTYFDRAIGLRTGHIEFDIPAGEVDDELLTDLYDLSKADDHGSRSNGGAGQGGPGGARTADRPPAGSVPPQPRFRTVD